MIKNKNLCRTLYRDTNNIPDGRVAVLSIIKHNDLYRVTHIIYNQKGYSENILNLERLGFILYTDTQSYFLYRNGRMIKEFECPPRINEFILDYNSNETLFLLYYLFLRAKHIYTYAAASAGITAADAASDAAYDAYAATDAAYDAYAATDAAAYTAADAAYAASDAASAASDAAAAYEAAYAASDAAAARDAYTAADAASAAGDAAGDAATAAYEREMRKAFRLLIKYRKLILKNEKPTV